MSPFECSEYSSLDRCDPHAFRLLRIIPAYVSAPIKVVLEHASRPSSRVSSEVYDQPSHISYRALSYTWGDDLTKVLVSVNNLPFLITPNLAEALTYLRRAPGEQVGCEFFWIDAICINQNDLFERNHQVAQMLDIYSNAKEVIIWLGPPTHLTDMAIKFIGQIYQLSQKEGLPVCDNGLNGDDFFSQFTIAGIIDRVTHNSDSYWQAVAELLLKPWWERSWVSQELACASVATLICGDKRLPWQEIALTIRILFTKHPKLTTLRSLHKFYKNHHSAITRAAKLYAIRASFRSGRIVGLGELNSGSELICGYDYLASQAQLTHCKDPRDKVYSFLGLSSATFRSLFKPDYNRSVAWTYAMVVKTNYYCCDNLNILRSIHSGISHKSFPSWTVDLNTRSPPCPHSLVFGNAAGTWSTSVLEPLVFSDDLKCMEVNGFTVDIIQDSKVQGTDVIFHPGTHTDGKAIFITRLLMKLMESGGIQNTWDPKNSADDLRMDQRIESTIYNVLTAGTGWCMNTGQHERLRVEYEASSNGLERPQLKNLEEIYAEFDKWTPARTLILSKKRYFGLAPSSTRPGDHICIIYGLGFPAILRPKEDDTWSFVGTAYVNGLMEGEAVKEFNGAIPPKEFVTTFKLR